MLLKKTNDQTWAKPRSVNFFCKGPDNKHFHLVGRMISLLQPLNFAAVGQKQPQMGVIVFEARPVLTEPSQGRMWDPKSHPCSASPLRPQQALVTVCMKVPSAHRLSTQKEHPS